MPEIVKVPVSDLLLDTENPRLEQTFADQQQTAMALALEQKEKLVNLAADIVARGMDPLTLTAVVATGDRRKRYKVVEGNRRVLALLALEMPSLVSAALGPKAMRELVDLSGRYAADPIDSIDCVLFASEEEADEWIELRHTGPNDGVGLVNWGSQEKDRFRARHSGARKPAGQVIDFVEAMGLLSDDARAGKSKIATNVERIVETTDARKELGIDVNEGQVVSHYPAAEVAKGLTRIVEDLRLGEIGVPQLYRVKDRMNYVHSLPRSARPAKSKRLKEPVLLADLTAGRDPKPLPKRKPKPKRRQATRNTLIPKDLSLDIDPPRLNAIYLELATLNAEQTPNACAVLLRVFIELSVDHLIAEEGVLSDKELNKHPLSKRLKAVAGHLAAEGRIPAKLRKAIDRIAEGRVFGASVFTLHQFVHNEYVFPQPRELYGAWDEIQPFVEAIWA